MICPRCGQKHVGRPYKVCFDCQRLEREAENEGNRIQHAADKRLDEQSHYYDNECHMCGKEGALQRRDGLFYCSGCWMIENS